MPTYVYIYVISKVEQICICTFNTFTCTVRIYSMEMYLTDGIYCVTKLFSLYPPPVGYTFQLKNTVFAPPSYLRAWTLSLSLSLSFLSISFSHSKGRVMCYKLFKRWNVRMTMRLQNCPVCTSTPVFWTLAENTK
jgi:hypothetical protein